MNEKPSHALDFFNKVNADGITFLKGLINSDPPSFETDWLDFKGAEQLKDKDVKRIWSEALAGFANTEGGVLVWGIDARPDPDTKIDCASGLSLVKKPATFVSRLKELHSQSTDPPIPGVDYWFAIDDGADDCGFAVSYVPESNFKPHRAEAAGRNYYIRAGDSFHVPSVSLLRNLFFPEYHSHLWPELRAFHNKDTVFIDGYLYNSGIATAKNVVLSIGYEAESNWTLEPSRRWEFVGVPNPNHQRGSGMACFLPIHPGAALPAFRLSLPITDRELARIEPVDFEIFMYCENNHPLVSKVTFSRVDIQDQATKAGKSEMRS
ncbi:MAG: ATP-binding protein [Syntrophales bacterium]|nr:ATP-binding protein [Syntrophales bacterium]